MVILMIDSGIGLTVAETLLRQRSTVELVIVVDDFATKQNNSLEILAEGLIENHVFELKAIKRDIDEFILINTEIEHPYEYKEKLINPTKPIVDSENLECPIRGSP